MRVTTHYDHLGVARDAPLDVIRTAYKTLCQRYHPDLNPGDHEATRIMAALNASYDVLSSPEKRQAHDHWIAQQERLVARAWQTGVHGNLAPMTVRPSTGNRAIDWAANLIVRIDCAIRLGWKNRLVLPVIALAIVIAGSVLASWRDAPLDLKIGPGQASPTADQRRPDHPSAAHLQLLLATAISAVPQPAMEQAKKYARTDFAPNGAPWPAAAGYLKNVPVLHDAGRGIMTVENAPSSGDVHVKLVALDGLREYVVREFYIPAYGNFVLKNLTPGLYDLRYRDLDNGRLARTEEFLIDERTASGSNAGNPVTMMILDKIQSNSVETFGLLESEF